MNRSNHIRGLLVGSVLLALSGVAAAQWVMLARHAVGRIEQMQQTAPKAADGAAGATISPALLEELNLRKQALKRAAELDLGLGPGAGEVADGDAATVAARRLLQQLQHVLLPDSFAQRHALQRLDVGHHALAGLETVQPR